MIETTHILMLSLVLLFVGLYGLVSKRNLIRVLISVEILINASLVNIVAFSGALNSASGLILALVGIAVAAAETTVGLAIMILLKREFGTIDTTKIAVLGGE